MYNRYIPQPDGSFRRNAVPDRQPQPRPQASEPPPCVPEPPPPVHPQPSRKDPHAVPAGNSVSGFLRQLLPKDFDTSDLLIVLLLLLMAGDNPEEQSNALLTLALYLFL